MPVMSPIMWLALLSVSFIILFFLYSILIFPHEKKIKSFFNSIKKKLPKW